MAMGSISDTGPSPDWLPVGTGLTAAILQANAPCDIVVANAKPPANTPGFRMEVGTPFDLGSVGALGGGIWARFTGPSGGNLTFAAA